MSATKDPSSLSEAIEKLETLGKSKAEDFRDLIDREYPQLRKAFEDALPQLEDLKNMAETEVKKTKLQVEDKVKENPWIALGIVGLIAFVIGWVISQSRKD